MDNHAWKKALILRGCPPSDVLFGPTDEPLRAHLDICPACREHLAMDAEEREGWAAMGRVLLAKPPLPLPPPVGKAPGQVWRIRADLTGWDQKYRYCNPPLVLVLDIENDADAANAANAANANTALVAQVYPGDDFLSEENVPLSGQGFAEPWNTYCLALDDLETYYGEATSAVAAVLDMGRGTFAELDETSPLFWFRTLELELGAFFAGQSLSRLLEVSERTGQDLKPLLLSAMSRQELDRALERKGLKIPLEGDDPLLRLARYTREDTHWGLAAMGEHTQSVNHALLDDADAMGLEIRQASITLSSVHYADGVLVLGGRINVDFARTKEVFAWWDAQDRMIRAAASDILDDSRYFNLRFAEVAEREFHIGRLVVLLSGRE